MTDTKQLNADSQRRFRAAHRRIDYAPRPTALAIINQHLFGDLGKSITGVIDKLILAGHEAITGNSGVTSGPVTAGAEDIVGIQHRRLTAKQELFACTVAMGNQSLTAAYRAVYDPQNAKPATVNKMAAELAALPHVAARIGLIRGGVAAALVKNTGVAREDSIRELGILRDQAMARGQVAAAVRATTLRAQLAGLLPSGRKPRNSKLATGSHLSDADIAALVKLRDETGARTAIAKETPSPVGEAPNDPSLS